MVLRTVIRFIPVFLLLCLFPFTYGYADIMVKSSSAKRLELSYRPGSLSMSKISANGKTYTLYRYDDHRLTSVVGAPSLPVKTVLFAAPSGVTPTVAITGLSSSTQPGIVIAPRPKLVRDKSGFTNEVYSEDPVSYALSGFRPSNFALLGDSTPVDGIAVWSLSFYPVLYDAHAATIAVADSFEVSIMLGGTSGRILRASGIPESVLNRDVFIEPSGEKLFKAAVESESPFAKGNWYRIAVSDSGMYSISGQDLNNAGLFASSTRFQDIHMYYGGGK
ncbi:MAG: C25 family peptidase propeptide domain-containing protein, partial [Candidatus Latescibacterota bacterium]